MGAARMLRVYAFVVLLSSIMVAVVVLGGHGGTSSTTEPVPPSTAVDRIAYVGPDGQIRTVNPNGTRKITITPDEGVYSWPTWSPNGRKLVFSGVTGAETDEPRVSLYAYNAFTRQLRELHVREPGVTGLVATNAPHYPIWAPNGNYLAFIGSTGGGLRLYLDDLRDGEGPKPAVDDAPLWLDWSADSQYLLVQRQGDHYLVDMEPFFREGAMTTLEIQSDGFGYNVPSWNPAGDEYAFVSGDIAGGYGLFTSRPNGDAQVLVERVSPSTAFLWSPDGRSLAVTQSDRLLITSLLRLSVYTRVSLYGQDGSTHPVDIEENVVAFFWSPDSTKLAYVTLTETPGVLRWKIFNVLDGASWTLTDFIPSLDQLTVYRHFDQYAHSHSLWSPDSTSLVFAGRTVGGATSASLRQRQPDRIVVVSTHRFSFVSAIANGVLGFWSPR